MVSIRGLQRINVISTYSDQFILGTGGQVAAVGAEADAADVQICAHVGSVVVLENTDLLTSLNVENLGRSVAASGDVLTIVTEPHAAHNAFVAEGMDQVDIQNALHLGVEDGIPVVASLLVVGSHSIDLEIAEGVTNGRSARTTHASVVGSGMADLRRLGVAGIGHGSVDLRSRGADGVGGPADASPARAGRSSALRRLGTHAIGDGALRIALGVGRLLLAAGVRRDGEAGRALSHLVLRSQLLLRRRVLLGRRLLLLLRGRLLTLLLALLLLLGRGETSLAAASHDTAKETVAGRDGRRLLRRAGVLRRAGDARLRGTFSGSLELMSEHADLLLVPKSQPVSAQVPKRISYREGRLTFA